MRKLLAFLFISLVAFATGVHPSLQSLLNRFNIEANQPVEGIVADTQRAWLRKSGTERWEMPELQIEDRVGTIKELRTLGLIDEIAPKKTQYDYALVLGSTLPSMKRRLHHLGEVWNRGVRFQKLVFLVSNRPLDSQGDKLDGTETVHTEAEAIMYLFQTESLPQELKNLPLQVIVAIGKVSRANTTDTVLAWLKEKPTPGSVLAVSAQPQVHYQDAVVRGTLPQTFSLDTTGGAAPDNLSISVALDALTRTLFARLEFDLMSRYSEPNEEPWLNSGPTGQHASRQ